MNVMNGDDDDTNDDDISKLLEAHKAGDPEATNELLTRAYNELRRIAARLMQGEREGHTLQATALVHEGILRLLNPDGGMPDWNTRGHFFASASQAMRRILIESARRKNSLKRGGDRQRTTWDEEAFSAKVPDDEKLRVHAALERLAQENPEIAQVAEMKYFGGMTITEIAFALDVSESTIERQWRGARAKLICYFSDEE